MSFIRALFLGVTLLSFSQGKEAFHIKGPYDIDADGQEETLVLNSRGFSAMFIEILPSGEDTLWKYSPENDLIIKDCEIVDLNGDGMEEIILIPSLITAFEDQPWLYVFLGNSSGFRNQPLTYQDTPFDLEIIRPLNLTLLSDVTQKVGVCFGSPIRQGMIFNITISNDSLVLENIKKISTPTTSNGYGVLQMEGFTSAGSEFITIISAEENALKTAILSMDKDFEVIHSETIAFDNASNILATDIQSYKSKLPEENGLLIPFRSSGVYLLSLQGKNVFLSKTSMSDKDAFPLTENETLPIRTILKNRLEIKLLETKPRFADSSFSRIAQERLPPPTLPRNSELKKQNSLPIPAKEDRTSMPRGKQELYYKPEHSSNVKDNYSMLSPTLGDFLTNVKEKPSKPKDKEEKISIPSINSEMESVNWADEAGFLQLDLGEYVKEDQDSIVKKSPVPSLDTGITNFTKEVTSLKQKKITNQDTLVIEAVEGQIDLYYVLVMTPASDIRDRYVFDGEAPFGVAVSQVPLTGKATHYKHGISANLANLAKGEEFDFAYSLRDASLDSITTFVMVHDLQTNMVLMSIKNEQDTLSYSQSYQPESFDPKLFEFPNYFFEGFPSSLDMDFSDKLIRFSFNGIEDPVYQGIYLSMTTPSRPPQSLSLFMDQGTLQAIRGEVVVNANGSKKVITEFDLTGTVIPSVMFSQLIEEEFSEDLKIQLLQGASLEEPLFGPKGKLPKITREPRLPDAEPDQPEHEIPVDPKMSNVPDSNAKIKEEKPNTSLLVPITQEDEIMPTVLEVQKQDNLSATATDTLKLEQNKELPSLDSAKPTPEPEQSQSEPGKKDKPSATATDTLKLEQNKKLPSPDSAKTTPNPEQSQSEPQKQESF